MHGSNYTYPLLYIVVQYNRGRAGIHIIEGEQVSIIVEGEQVSIVVEGEQVSIVVHYRI